MRRFSSVLLAMIAGALLLAMLGWLAGPGPLGVAEAWGRVEFLGEGQATYTLTEGVFVVKRGHNFTVDYGPEYVAQDGDRVWLSQIGGPEIAVRRVVYLGQVVPGCQVTWQAIDDDPDDRINTFTIDGQPVQDMDQGLVTSGQFTAPMAGTLALVARDSIGLWFDICPNLGTPDPGTATPEASQTPAPSSTPEATATRPPTQTPAPSQTATPEVTPSATPDPGTATPEASQTPAPATPRPTASPTARPTKTPRLPACTRINFEVSGHVAAPGTYVVAEVWGRVLTTWQPARPGLQDSGTWLAFDISYPAVWVQVVYHPGDGRPPVPMAIINHAPDLPWGWLARGTCHALEVGWPEH